VQEEAFSAMASIVLPKLEALNDALKEGCLQSAFAIARIKPRGDAGQRALQLLAEILKGGSADIGEIFIRAGGPQLLVDYVRSRDDHCNAAMMAVLHIASNAGCLANVMAHLRVHAGEDVETLCENFCPGKNRDFSGVDLADYFQDAFGRRPLWAVPEVCTLCRATGWYACGPCY
jgi:hypothetical protein